MQTTETFTATEFKAKCLEIFDRLAARKLTRVSITKRGKTVAVISPPDDSAATNEAVFGCMRGTIHLPPDLDLTAPVFYGPILAERGILFSE